MLSSQGAYGLTVNINVGFFDEGENSIQVLYVQLLMSVLGMVAQLDVCLTSN